MFKLGCYLCICQNIDTDIQVYRIEEDIASISLDLLIEVCEEQDFRLDVFQTKCWNKKSTYGTLVAKTRLVYHQLCV